jgi:hypothetical protein
MSVYQRVHVCETMNIVCKVYVGCMQLGCCSSSTAFHAFIIEGSGSILVHTAVANPIKPNNPNPTNQHSNPTSQPMGKPTNLDRLPWPWQLMLSLGSSWLRVAWFTWLLVGLWVDQPPPSILQVKRIQNRVSLWLEDDSDFLLDMYVLCVCCVCVCTTGYLGYTDWALRLRWVHFRLAPCFAKAQVCVIWKNDAKCKSTLAILWLTMTRQSWHKRLTNHGWCGQQSLKI